jgi:hypothetical protein
MKRSHITLRLLLGSASFAYADVALAQVAPVELWGLDEIVDSGAESTVVQRRFSNGSFPEVAFQPATISALSSEEEFRRFVDQTTAVVASNALWGLEQLETPRFDRERQFVRAEGSLQSSEEQSLVLVAAAPPSLTPAALALYPSSDFSPGMRADPKVAVANASDIRGDGEASRSDPKILVADVADRALPALGVAAIPYSTDAVFASTDAGKVPTLKGGEREQSLSADDIFPTPQFGHTVTPGKRRPRVQERAGTASDFGSVRMEDRNFITASATGVDHSVTFRTELGLQETDERIEQYRVASNDSPHIQVLPDVVRMSASARAPRSAGSDPRKPIGRHSAVPGVPTMHKEAPNQDPGNPLPFRVSDELLLRSRKELFG